MASGKWQVASGGSPQLSGTIYLSACIVPALSRCPCRALCACLRVCVWVCVWVCLCGCVCRRAMNSRLKFFIWPVRRALFFVTNHKSIKLNCVEIDLNGVCSFDREQRAECGGAGCKPCQRVSYANAAV